MKINERVLLIRQTLGLSQEMFGEKIGLTKSGISNIEKGNRSVTERHIKLISSQFNVSEEWLRTGQGEMFIQTDLFSLDEYAKRSNLSALEYDIIRGYMDLDEEMRKALLAHFKNIFTSRKETSAAREIDIEEEVANYRRELEAEKSISMSSASRYENGSA